MIERFFESEFLNIVIWSNYISEYINAVIYFVIALCILYILQRVIMKRFEEFAKKTKTEIDDVIVEFINSIRPRLYIVFAIYFALRTLILSAAVKNILNIILIVVVVFQITRSLQIVIEFAAKKLNGDDEDDHAKSAAHLLSAIATIVVWIFGILMILSNIGVDITSIIAGVGIGGIAIAFAVREVLADLFSSFAIYFDKPFRAGDTVKIGSDVGEIKKIGIKTTRVKSRTGEELIISNQEMTSSRIHNYKRMDHRNVKLVFSVEFDTPIEKLEEIPKKIEEIINGVDNIKFKRSHLKEFGQWGLVFDTMYQVQSSEYSDYMKAQQKVNLDVKKMLNDIEVEIAVARA